MTPVSWVLGQGSTDERDLYFVHQFTSIRNSLNTKPCPGHTRILKRLKLVKPNYTSQINR